MEFVESFSGLNQESHLDRANSGRGVNTDVVVGDELGGLFLACAAVEIRELDFDIAR